MRSASILRDVDVDGRDVVALLREGDRERQPDVSHSDDSNAHRGKGRQERSAASRASTTAGSR